MALNYKYMSDALWMLGCSSKSPLKRNNDKICVCLCETSTISIAIVNTSNTFYQNGCILCFRGNFVVRNGSKICDTFQSNFFTKTGKIIIYFLPLVLLVMCQRSLVLDHCFKERPYNHKSSTTGIG